jgi:UDP-N-acetylglucosamine 2-epimerase (non-hydrolysing)
VIHFVVGTRAQLLKLAPVMLECEKRGLAWRWVYTAQHRDTIRETLDTFGIPAPDHVVVRWQTEAKSFSTMARWFTRMLMALPRSKQILGTWTGGSHVVVTHGDTFTTWLGALMGKLTRTDVMHVESGLRSFNLRKPFPEEINRIITFRLADYYACQDEEAVKNLHRRKGIKLNTRGNTQIDTLRFGLEHAAAAAVRVPEGKFVVATIHRYENIFDGERLARIVTELEGIATQFEVLFIRHPATGIQLRKLGLLERVERNPRIRLMPRLEYLPFIATVQAAEFVVTDGGGNQAELFYLGKPTLIFRDEVEQREGLGRNAVLSRLDPDVIRDFVSDYAQFERPTELPSHSPAATIVDFLEARGFGGRLR